MKVYIDGRCLGKVHTYTVLPDEIRILTDAIVYPSPSDIEYSVDPTMLLNWVRGIDPNWVPNDHSISDVVIEIVNDLLYPDFLSGAYISLIQDWNLEGFRVYAAIRDLDEVFHAFYEDKSFLKSAMKAMFVLKDLRSTYWWDERLVGVLTRASQLFGVIYKKHNIGLSKKQAQRTVGQPNLRP